VVYAMHIVASTGICKMNNFQLFVSLILISL